MKTLHIIAFVLLVIGGLNWLFVSFGWNLVAALFGTSIVATIIYFLVGVSAIYEAVTHMSHCKTCGSGKMMAK